MKSKLLLLIVLAALGRAAASPGPEELRRGLADTERAFCADAARLGIADAFLAHMADSCFLPQRLGLGKAEYAASVQAARAKAGAAYKPGPNPDVQLTWSPLRVEVSDDGTLGYTWGSYDFKSRGKDGKVDASRGIYLTIWRRQADGSWKFVFDGSPEIPEDPKALAAFLSRGDLPEPAK